MNNIGTHKIKNHSSEIIFTMLLFFMFTFMILTVLISGVSVYKNTEEIMHNRYEERTAMAYVMTRLRQSDTYDSIYLDSNHIVDSMVIIKEYLFGMEYRTYMYCYNGWIYELFTTAEFEFDPNAGTPIVEAEDLNFEMKTKDLLYIECTATNGTVSNIHINLNSIKS